jgi:hypothetical protein
MESHDHVLCLFCERFPAGDVIIQFDSAKRLERVTYVRRRFAWDSLDYDYYEPSIARSKESDGTLRQTTSTYVKLRLRRFPALAVYVAEKLLSLYYYYSYIHLILWSHGIPYLSCIVFLYVTRSRPGAAV